MKIHPHKRRNTKSIVCADMISAGLRAKTGEITAFRPIAWLGWSTTRQRVFSGSFFITSLFLCLLSLASKVSVHGDETNSTGKLPQRETEGMGERSSLAVDQLPPLPSDSLEAQPSNDSESLRKETDEAAPAQNNPRAVTLLKRVLQQLVHGPAFHCKVRETVWTNQREVIGVGTYEQAGQGTGRYHLQVTMHDGSGRHRLQQISDGRLAWTRTEIASGITLRRVDVGRLDEWVGRSNSDHLIAPRYTVGAWVELLSTIYRDYDLDLVGATLENEPVWVLKGEITSKRRSEIMSLGDRTSWPALFPTRVHIAIASRPDDSSELGTLLPLRFEFWSDPPKANIDESKTDPTTSENLNSGRLITLIELYSIRAIIAPPVERFRFENQEAEVNFINETDRYIQMHGIQLTEREKLRLRR